MKTLSVLIVTIVGTWLGFAWVLMLEIGVAHRDWWPLMPLMSYHVALIFAGLGVLLGVIVGVLKSLVGDD